MTASAKKVKKGNKKKRKEKVNNDCKDVKCSIKKRL